MHHCAGLFSVTGAVVEDISVGRITSERTGAGERTEEQHLALKRVGQCHCCRGCSDIPDDGKDLVFFVEALHCLGGTSRFITVVRCNETKHPAVHSATGVGCIEGSFNAQLHVLTKLFTSAAERCEIPNRISLSVTPRNVVLAAVGSWPNG